MGVGLIILLGACSRPWTDRSAITPASIWTSGEAPTNAGVPTRTNSYILPSPRSPGVPAVTPTPDNPHYQTGGVRGPRTYVVRSGDMLSAIAERFSVTIEALIAANHIPNPEFLELGQTLVIPEVTPEAPGPAYKIIPDSEIVYGPSSDAFDIAGFIRDKNGYLATYNQVVDGENMDAAHVIQLIAKDYSINPRLLLAVLEYRSGWVTNASPDPSLGDTPFGFNDGWYVGLYRQLAWASIQLNSGFYRWSSNNVTDWVLEDGSVVPIDPTINPGTAGVQNFFAHLDDHTAWLRDVSPGGFFDTYYLLFGYSFDTAIEPLVPATLAQPLLLLPFGTGETWAFTGGPHLAWDAGTPFGALDFAPPGEALGCVETNAWVTAVGDGLVTRTGNGVVMLDLDGDNNEGTGWVILYMHIESRDRVQPGTYLRAGEAVGHPSCEGGVSSGTHVHLARKFNGVWVSADGQVPFNLSGWVASGTGEEYVGTLTRFGVMVTSFEGNNPINQIQR